MSDWINSLFETLGYSWNESAPLLLFLSSFLSATLLPGSSEVTLLTTLSYSEHTPTFLVVVASLGNTLGGLVNFLIGLWLPNRTDRNTHSQKSITWLATYGYWALLFSWLPLIGDGLCLAAGWLRMKFIPAFFCIFIGKTIRYSILSAIYFGVF